MPPGGVTPALTPQHPHEVLHITFIGRRDNLYLHLQRCLWTQTVHYDSYKQQRSRVSFSSQHFPVSPDTFVNKASKSGRMKFINVQIKLKYQRCQCDAVVVGKSTGP